VDTKMILVKILDICNANNKIYKKYKSRKATLFLLIF
jgi:hypothetical protein